MSETLRALHTGGIEWSISIHRDVLPDVLKHLTTCHSHVFVVDQANKDITNRVNIGVSVTGLNCIHKALEMIK